MNLYELTAQYQELLEMAEDGSFDTQTINDTFESLDGEIEDKAENYAKVIKTLEGDSESLKTEIDRLKDRKNVIDNNIDRMKLKLQTAMTATGKTKFKTPLFSFGIQKNPPTALIPDESKIPKKFWVKQEPKLDKRAVIDYLKANGDQKWGTLTQSESLRIR